MRSALIILQLCLCLAIALGFAGAIHPIGDSFAVFREYFIAAVFSIAAIGLIIGPRKPHLLFVILAMFVLGRQYALHGNPLLPPILSHMPSHTIYQRNLLHNNQTPELIIEEIDRLRPDFITLQEVSMTLGAGVLHNLPEGYTAVRCPSGSGGGVALATLHIVNHDTVICHDSARMVAAQIDTPNGSVWLVSLHLFWPWPYNQSPHAAQLEPILAALDGPVIIAGDFNMAAGSFQVQRIAELSGAERVRQGNSTFQFMLGDWRGPGVNIDHVLIPEGLEAEIRPLDYLGSDHRGLLVGFDLPAN